jgi:hypothetical protein
METILLTPVRTVALRRSGGTASMPIIRHQHQFNVFGSSASAKSADGGALSVGAHGCGAGMETGARWKQGGEAGDKLTPNMGDRIHAVGNVD